MFEEIEAYCPGSTFPTRKRIGTLLDRILATGLKRGDGTENHRVVRGTGLENGRAPIRRELLDLYRWRLVVVYLRRWHDVVRNCGGLIVVCLRRRLIYRRLGWGLI